MLCVEEAGDAAGNGVAKPFVSFHASMLGSAVRGSCRTNKMLRSPLKQLAPLLQGFATLGKAKQVDPTYKRTVLIRNKLDK